MTAPPAIQPVERAIASMLLERVGSSILDSGLLGRAWQAARARYGLDSGLPNDSFSGFPQPTDDPTDNDLDRVVLAMRETPEGSIDEFGIVSIDTFHWLVHRLDYDPSLHELYEGWCEAYNARRGSWDQEYGTALAEAFLDALWDSTDEAVTYGIYPHEGGQREWTNTYNHEENLDRILQFILFHVERDGLLPEGSYVLLQIHGGADVRGGYTDPRLFRVDGDPSDLFDFGYVEVMCEGAAVVPDGALPGQIGIDGTEAKLEYVQHRWDNWYGDGRLRKADDYDEEALALNPDSEDYEPEPYEQTGVHAVKRWVTAHLIDGVWRCPHDDSPLHAGGQVVG